MFDEVKKISLAHLPTPLDSASRLATHLGLKSLFIKRDDLTGLGLGGNKARKLEYELASVLENGYDTVITIGGQQSNHARMTAAACRKLGLDIKLVLNGNEFSEIKGNLLLDALYGAEIRYLQGTEDDDEVASVQMIWMEELIQQGKKPYALPLGGSTPLGTLGYVNAMKELKEQLADDNVQIILPVGSCGTFAGVVLGAGIYLPNASITGISVSRTKENILKRTRSLIRETASIYGFDTALAEREIEVFDNYHVKYAVHVKPAIDAAAVLARLEGLIVDQVYTGKALAGLFDLAEKNYFNKEVPVIFLHTGGIPEVFADTLYPKEYSKIKIYNREEVNKLRK